MRDVIFFLIPKLRSKPSDFAAVFAFSCDFIFMVRAYSSDVGQEPVIISDGVIHVSHCTMRAVILSLVLFDPQGGLIGASHC